MGPDHRHLWDRGIPPMWLDQLTSTGVILAPIALAGAHPITRLTPTDSSLSGQLSAHVVCWADFMPAAGPLRPAECFHHDPHHPVNTDPARPADTVVDTELSWDQYCALTCWLGVHDSRATRAYVEDEFNAALGMTALVEHGAAAWIQMSGRIVTAGPTEHTTRLENRLSELVTGWTAAGSPPAERWCSELAAHPGLTTPLLAPGGWHQV